MRIPRRGARWSRLVASWIRKRPLLTLNLGVVAASVTVAVRVYRGFEGQGDDLQNLNPAAHPTEWHYLTMLYTQWGQVGFGVLMVPLRLLVRIFRVGPDGFPWWCFAGLNAALNVLSVVHFVLAGKALLRHGHAWTFGLIAFVSGLWLVNPVTFATTVGIPVVFFSAYTLPLYLISLILLGFASGGITAARTTTMLLVGLYVVVSLNEATFMLSLPALVVAFTAIKAQRSARPLEAFVKTILPWAAASAAAALFVWTTPGFHHRAPLLGFAVPPVTGLWSRIPAWYADSARMSYDALFGGRIEYPVVLHTFLLALLSGGLLVHLLRPARRRELGREEGPRLLDVNILAVGYLLAAHAAMSTTLFTPYFPEYTKVYPALLVALGIATSILWATGLAGSIGARYNGTPHAGAAAAAVVVGFVILWAGAWAGVDSSSRVLDAYRHELRASRTLREARYAVRTLYRSTGQLNYTLSHCPPRLEAYGGAMLRPDYFTWQGLPALSVIQEGKEDPTALSRRPAATRIRCEVPAVIPWTWSRTPESSTSPVRVVSYVAADGRGVENHDFFVAADALSCTVRGSYNPNVAGSPLYRNAFEYRLLLSTSYSYTASPPSLVRSLTIGAGGHAKGPINPAASVSVGYVDPNEQLTSETPLEGFDATGSPPLLRVSLQGLYPGWLTAYTSVRLECQ